MIYSGPWHSAPYVLSSFVSLVWKTDFQIVHRYVTRWVDKTWQEAGFWALSPALVASDHSWWLYFFNFSDLIAHRGQWYLQVCQSHSTPLELSKTTGALGFSTDKWKQLSCDKCLLHMLLRGILTAKSTICSLPARTCCCLSAPVSLRSTVIEKIACDLELCSFMLVAPTEPAVNEDVFRIIAWYFSYSQSTGNNAITSTLTR